MNLAVHFLCFWSKILELFMAFSLRLATSKRDFGADSSEMKHLGFRRFVRKCPSNQSKYIDSKLPKFSNSNWELGGKEKDEKSSSHLGFVDSSRR